MLQIHREGGTRTALLLLRGYNDYRERDRLEKHLQEAYFAKLSSADGDESLVPKAVPFIPYAYQLDVRKKEFKTNPTLKKFHEFIVNETAIVSCGKGSLQVV